MRLSRLQQRTFAAPALTTSSGCAAGQRQRWRAFFFSAAPSTCRVRRKVRSASPFLDAAVSKFPSHSPGTAHSKLIIPPPPDPPAPMRRGMGESALGEVRSADRVDTAVHCSASSNLPPTGTFSSVSGYLNTLACDVPVLPLEYGEQSRSSCLPHAGQDKRSRRGL